jgi:indolepyruvate ferredoxin oxidoreductase beta subunit
LSKNVSFVNITDDAVKLGNPIFGNIMMIGDLAETGELPIAREDFVTVISKTMSSDRVAANLFAFDRGTQMISTLRAGMDDAMGT